MHHCVGGYASACASGESRIFSLRAGGERVATLEIRLRGRATWVVRQCFGPCNDHINDQAVLAAADKVAASYSQLHAQQKQALQPVAA